MKSISDDLTDKGMYCWECNGYVWYGDEVKKEDKLYCPKGHLISG